MSTVTVKITTRSKKAKYLLGLIEELSKSDKGIKTYDVAMPNSITLKAMDAAKKGHVRKAKSIGRSLIRPERRPSARCAPTSTTCCRARTRYSLAKIRDAGYGTEIT